MFVYIRSAAFVIVFTQKLVLQQSKNVTAKCMETFLPPPSIQFSLLFYMIVNIHYLRVTLYEQCTVYTLHCSTVKCVL